MRYLITGGAGFIGCNAAAYFQAHGHAVVCGDNFARAGSRQNARWLEEEHGVSTRVVNVQDGEAVEALVREVQPDVVLHCAAQVAVTTSVTDPRSDFLDNALGTFNTLEAVRKWRPEAVFLFTSTNKVYGGMEDVEVELAAGRYSYKGLPSGCDEGRPLDFHSPYGCSKGAADQYVRDYARIYGLQTVVFRQSCIYGYRQFGVEDQGWVAWFTIRAAQGKPVTIYGDGNQVRDVLFIDDLLGAFAAAVDHVETTRGRVYNVGGGPANTLSLHELVALLRDLTGQRLAVSYAAWRPGDQRVFVSDIGRARADLGWAPRVGVREGVTKLLGWVTNNLPVLAEVLR
jgi:CDP-paratose 2-epimerase